MKKESNIIKRSITIISLIFLVATSNSKAIDKVSIDLNYSQGINKLGEIITGEEVKIAIRFENSTNSITGFTIGFRVFSLTGAEWGSTNGIFSGNIDTTMMESTFINLFDNDGVGADTVGFGGFKLLMPGIHTGFEEIVSYITIGPIDRSYIGHTICFDSCYYPVAGEWTWASIGGQIRPEWDFPYCFTVGNRFKQSSNNKNNLLASKLMPDLFDLIKKLEYENLITTISISERKKLTSKYSKFLQNRSTINYSKYGEKTFIDCSIFTNDDGNELVATGIKHLVKDSSRNQCFLATLTYEQILKILELPSIIRISGNIGRILSD